MHAMGSTFGPRATFKAGGIERQHVFCHCRDVRKACAARMNSTRAQTCINGLAEHCKTAMSGILLSLAATAFTPHTASALGSESQSLSPDVPVVRLQSSAF